MFFGGEEVIVTKLFSAQERITCSKSRGGMGFRDLKEGVQFCHVS